MAAEIAVLEAVLPHSGATGTISVTRGGFGTPQAAIIYTAGSTVKNSQQTHFYNGFGYWDGTNTYSISGFAQDSVSTTNSSRRAASAKFSLVGLNEDDLANYTISSTTDGVNIAWGGGSVTSSILATVILIKGVVNAKTGIITNYFASGGTYDINTVGFRPTIVFFTGGAPTFDNIVGVMPITHGVAHCSASGVVSQGTVYSATRNNGTINNANMGARVDKALREYQAAGAVSSSLTASDFDSSGFSLTADGNLSDDIAYLALQLSDHDDAYVGDLTVPGATGSQVISGLPFEPCVVGMWGIGSSNVTGEVTSPASTLSLGVSDGTASHCHSYGTSNLFTTRSTRWHTTSAVFRTYSLTVGSGSRSSASVTGLNADGWSLNWTQIQSGARVVLWSIGNSAAATAPTVAALAPTSLNKPRFSLTF